jgi:hypothetical protein
MPKSLSSNMYGTDDNALAESIASASLGGQPNSGNEDFWMGDVAQDDSLVSKANVGEESSGPLGQVPKLNKLAAGNSADTEKFRMPPQWKDNNAHIAGPKSSTADGYEAKYVPQNQTTTTVTDKAQTSLYNRPQQNRKGK